ncbi:hypothetical protein [Shewanella sp. HL-SH2]|uniref:hypothetical protein n=1 Tax=Shewanella sp. HL-SH2 TaxID=3436238 RepID=UPI003EB6C6E4
MSEVKMMDFFKLPANELVMKIDQNKASVLNCDGVSEFQAIDVAVSAYDNNQAIIKKLQEQIVHERIDKHSIITNHLNVLVECIKSVPVPEYGREHNIKMRDAILNVMANSVAPYQVEPADLKKKAVESLRQAIQDCEEFGRVYVELNGQWAKGHQQVTGVVVDDVGGIVIC